MYKKINTVLAVIFVTPLFHVLVWHMQTKEYKLIHRPKEQEYKENGQPKAAKMLLALSGLKQALTNNPGYNMRVAECKEAARILLE
jgi:galactokinase